MPSKALAVFSAGPRTRKGGREGGSRAGHQTRNPHTRREKQRGGRGRGAATTERAANKHPSQRGGQCQARASLCFQQGREHARGAPSRTPNEKPPTHGASSERAPHPPTQSRAPELTNDNTQPTHNTHTKGRACSRGGQRGLGRWGVCGTHVT